MNIKSFHQFNNLNEAHFEDVYGEEFTKFQAKYTSLIKSGKLKTPEKMYVQFTNLKDNALDKSIHEKPDHSDPIGIYAYPLSYVLNHPSDIWYGSTAKNLRVIRDLSKSKLVLNSIKGSAGLNKALHNIGVEHDDQKRLIKLAQKTYPNRFTGINKFAKIFLTILQMDFDGEIEKESPYNDPKIKVFSGREQTKRLLNYYDAIEDKSRNSEDAIINDREPEQICFLSRSAFDIVDVISIHKSHKKGETLIINQHDPRKLAALIANAMDDKLTGGFIKATMTEYNRYWTVKGRRIELDYSISSDYRDGLGIGKKHHRWSTFSDHYELSGIVYTEYGSFSLNDDEGKRYQDIIEEFIEDFNNEKENGASNDWKPETKASYEQKQKTKADAEREAYAVEQRKGRIKEYTEYVNILKKWADLMNIPYEIPTNEKVIYDIGEGISTTLRKFIWRHEKIEIVLSELNELFDMFGDMKDGYKDNLSGYEQVMQGKEVMKQILLQHPFIALEPHATEFNFRNIRTEYK